MKVLRDPAGWEAGTAPVVTVGSYDGVHRGHQCDPRPDPREGGGAFRAHPGPRLHPAPGPDRAARVRTAPHHHRGQREELLRQEGMDFLLLHPFDPELAALSPLISRARFWRSGSAAASSSSGGTSGSGTIAPARWRSCAASARSTVLGWRGWSWRACPTARGSPPTHIRDALQAGRIERANEMLGRVHALEGTCIPGLSRGRTLGFPTANLEPENELLPADGVYVSETEVAGARHPSVTNIGVRSHLRRRGTRDRVAPAPVRGGAVQAAPPPAPAPAAAGGAALRLTGGAARPDRGRRRGGSRLPRLAGRLSTPIHKCDGVRAHDPSPLGGTRARRAWVLRLRDVPRARLVGAPGQRGASGAETSSYLWTGVLAAPLTPADAASPQPSRAPQDRTSGGGPPPGALLRGPGPSPGRRASAASRRDREHGARRGGRRAGRRAPPPDRGTPAPGCGGRRRAGDRGRLPGGSRPEPPPHLPIRAGRSPGCSDRSPGVGSTATARSYASRLPEASPSRRRTAPRIIQARAQRGDSRVARSASSRIARSLSGSPASIHPMVRSSGRRCR